MPQEMLVLGAGTALPDIDRDNTSLLWLAGTDSVLLDCGGRAYQQMLRAGVDPRDVRALVLTHSHPDHIYGVPALLFHLWLAQYQRTLDVYANAPTLAMVRKLCDVLELPQHGYMCAVNWHELSEDPAQDVITTAQYTLSTTPVVHSVPTLAIKLVDHETQRTLVYSADTEPCATFDRFAQGATTMIHEATVPDPSQPHGHTTPFQAGQIAHRAGVEQLILIHYSSVYTMPEADAIAQIREAGFEGQAEAARELARYPA